MDKQKPSPKGTSAKPDEVKKPTQHPSAEKKEPQKPGKPTGYKH